MINLSKEIVTISRKLTHVDLEITRKCNLNCVHCSAESKNRGKEMSLERMKDILVSAKKLGLQKVGFTGGEPFLERDKLIELGNFAKKTLNIPIHIHTNGTLISNTDANWVKKIDGEITVAIYGPTKEIHDKITRIDGSFESSLIGCRHLIESNSKLCVYIVPMKINFKSIKATIELLAREGVKEVRILTLSPTGRAKCQFENLELNENDLKFLTNDLKKIDSTNIRISTGFCTSQNIEGLPILSGHEECFAAENRVHIDSSGNVFPCTASSGRIIFSAGNLQSSENTLCSIWEDSPLLQFFRYFHKHPPVKCIDCSDYLRCMAGCRVKMSYKYNDVTIADPKCKGPYLASSN